MSLFEVKGWNVPAQAVVAESPSQASRKRKRLVNEMSMVQLAQVNVEKLMKKAEKSSFEARNEHKRKRKNRQRAESSHVPNVQKSKSLDGLQAKSPKAKRDRDMDSESAFKESKERLGTSAPKRVKRNVSGTPSCWPLKSTNDDMPVSKREEKASRKTGSSFGLTSLQSNMKDSLDGARFRWINEVLYTSGSTEGHELMQNDPKLYEEYHTGFRQQVCSWPSNPVNHYISILSSYPKGTVIADLGCGDAMLARSLVPKGYCVLSYDLVSDGAYVLEADVCKKIPLPGMEDAGEDNHGQIVDVCICALSLMSLDWVRCIRETWRVLRLGGELKVAEVASRFVNLSQFITVIGGLGFTLKYKDDSNTHFTLFEFRKVPRAPLTANEWDALQAKHQLLKPCEYKRR